MPVQTFGASRQPQKLPSLARELGRAAILTLVVLAASGATSACSSSSAGAGAPPADADSGTPGTGADSEAPETGADTGAATGSDAGLQYVAVAFFRGTLAGSVAASQALSDPFFNGIKAQATGAGDDGHDMLLGTTDLGTTLDQFVGLDTWSSEANMDMVYANPQVQAFGAQFYASPPEFKTFRLTDFHQWGNTDSADMATPHYFVMIRGRYSTTPDQIKATHDAFAQAAEAQYKTAGNVAHIVWSGRQDSQDALIVDVWTSNTNIDSFYGNAQLASSLSSLFDTTGPNYGVYGTTDWVTW